MPASRRGPRSKDPVEIRRSRGEISCAECRRHKLKCNKAIPCGTCIRKGCQEICPNGTLTPGQVARANLREPDAQMQKLSQMSKRIQQLEDALQIAHGSTSTATHPLLSADLLKIKNLIERPLGPGKEADASDEDTIDSVGTLAILGRGIESYVGADKLVIDYFGSAEAMHFKLNSGTSPSTFHPDETFPFMPPCHPGQDTQAQIEEKLPPIERASALVEAYLENTSWLMRVVDREQIMEELIPQVYRRRRVTNGSTSGETHPTDPHTLAALLAVFACGAAADLTLPPLNEEAHLYYHLAWMAISLRSVFDGAGMHTVQALAVLGTYDVFSCRKNSLEGTWKMISFCMSLAESIGLHRDPAHFKLPPKMIQRRRRVFWELHSMDVWKSIGSGRPLTLHPSVVDCELPEDTDATVTEDGTKVPSVWGIRARYSKDVMADIVEKLSSARSLKYSEILLLDQKIREFGPEDVMSKAANASAATDGRARNVLISFLFVLLKDATLILLHRSFFVRALAENPTNPTQSHFAPSFLAAYRSAAIVLRALRGLLDTSAHFIYRIWPVWAHALSASVMLGSVAACGTTLALAPQAFAEFNLSIDMLAKVHMQPLVKDLMPMVLQLRDRAYQALIRHGNNVPTPRKYILNYPPATKDEKDFNVVSGLGRIIRKGLEGRFGHSHQGIHEYLEEESRSITPSTPSGNYPEAPEGLYSQRSFLSQVSTPLTDQPEKYKRAQESPGGSNFSQTTGQLSVEASSPSMTGNTRAVFQPSPHYDSAQGVLAKLLPQNDLRLPLEAHLGHTTPSQHPPSHISVRQLKDQDVDDAHLPHPDSLHPPSSHDSLPAPPSSDFNDYLSSLGNSIGHTETQMDTPVSSFNLDDSLSALSPATLFNTDFDVSFDMRAFAGDENIFTQIPDDLAAPCRTIFQDSRFFGNTPTPDAGMHP